MSLIGLEISDAGIMAASSASGELLAIDGKCLESPGFALPGKNGFIVGRVAEQNAHLHPRYSAHTFWNQLDTEPLKQPGFEKRNHTELAYAHLRQVWEAVKQWGNEVIIAVPEFFPQKQLGLILGIAKELSMPVKGFVPMALAASSKPYAGDALFFLDAHLHRFVLSGLAQKDQLSQTVVESWQTSGLYPLYTELVNTVADAFVQQTRFDPFHQAASEQELYNRLPALIKDIQSGFSATFQMKAGTQIHRISLGQEPFLEKIRPVFHEIQRKIDGIRKHFGKPDNPLTLQFTHRASRMFGFEDMLNRIPDMQIISLQPGAAALGVLQLAEQFAGRSGVPLLSSRPWREDGSDTPEAEVPRSEPNMRPTHLLYRNLAYPITTRLLIIGRGETAESLKISLKGKSDDVPYTYCTIQLRNDTVFLSDHGNADIFINEAKVSQAVVLRLGQTLRIGGTDANARFIACVNTDET